MLLFTQYTSNTVREMAMDVPNEQSGAQQIVSSLSDERTLQGYAVRLRTVSLAFSSATICLAKLTRLEDGALGSEDVR